MMTRLLEEVQPKYIIMYDSDLTFIRQVEVLWSCYRPCADGFVGL